MLSKELNSSIEYYQNYVYIKFSLYYISNIYSVIDTINIK